MTLIKHTFYPLVVVLTMSLNYFLLDYVPAIYIPLTSLVCISSAMCISIICERVIPFKKQWNINQGDFWTDIIQTNFMFPIILKLTEFMIFFLVAKFSFKIMLPGNFENYPIFIRLAILVILAEFIYYWVHRLGHTVKLLWRFHVIHHGANRLYWANSAKFNAIDEFVSIFFYLIPFALFSSDVKVLALFYTFTAVTGVLEHVNVDFKGRYLNYIFNTAHLHRWHHSVKIKECNSNYGKILSIWDLVFKTWYLPKNKEVSEIGIKMTRQVPNSVLGQTIYPFTDISIKSEGIN